MLLFAKLLCHLTLQTRSQQATVARQAAASNAAAWFQARLSGSSANISTQAQQHRMRLALCLCRAPGSLTL
jgi:hypothetical protein